MRKAVDPQLRLDARPVQDVTLNLDCRDEIIPILRALQHLYGQPALRDEVLKLVAQDVNPDSRSDRGREGMDYWTILVLAAVRLGCNLDYDKLQDLAEQHRNLRHMMGLGDWEMGASFSWQRIRDNICLLKPTTIEKISQALVAEGHRFCPEAAEQVRADAFVIETNIHYPSESSLLRDGIGQIVKRVLALIALTPVAGWRQAKHLLKRVRGLSREIDRVASRKGPNYETRLKDLYRELLGVCTKVTDRGQVLVKKLKHCATVERLETPLRELERFLQLTNQVCDTARRRVLLGETVPNDEKLFSMYETHTQLYKRGKAGEPVQFGRLVVVYEDSAGFLVHHHLLLRDQHDRDVTFEQAKVVKARLGERLKSISYDRGFHTPENQKALADLIPDPCLPKPGHKQARVQDAEATEEFRRARRRHPGIESAIGALQAGNGQARCRDRTEYGLQRYLALGVLGRNLHVLGKLLIARESPNSLAAATKRQAA